MKMLLSICMVLTVVAINRSAKAELPEYDIVIYGGTSAAISAAVQATRMDKTVVIVCPEQRIGGLSSNGLGWTDSGNNAVVGGLAREFYQRIWRHYQNEDAWRWQLREEYGNRGQYGLAIEEELETMWIFEPHVAEKVFEDWVKEYNIPIFRDEWLDRDQGVSVQNGSIESITMLSGNTYRGRVFIDATYEGDLMAAAGVTYTVGREANRVYGETLNGIQTERTISHQFDAFVDPYIIPGDPDSGLLPRIHGDSPGIDGEGDHRVQAYNFRLCLTKVPENRIPFPKPDNYDPMQYELLGRYIETGYRGMFGKFDPIPNLKTDTNNHGAFSTDNIGMNYEYPEASYAQRREIIREHEDYQKGYFWFLANDPRVADDVREQMSQWGLAKDEFADNDHWPTQLYVREARRMVGDFVVTENHLRRIVPTPRSIGMGSYNMDSHNTQRYVAYDDEGRGYARNEGDIQISPGGPYPIDLGAILPKAQECTNLLVPVCVSTSHIAYGSVRMEPVFMILGQSAATTAVFAIRDSIAVQDVDYTMLSKKLVEDGQILEMPYNGLTQINPDTLPGIVQLHTDAEVTGSWKTSHAIPRMVGRNYLHDSPDDQVFSEIQYKITLPAPGNYEVRMSYTAHANRATNVPVTIVHKTGKQLLHINQQQVPEIDHLFTSLGHYAFDTEAQIIISNDNADGYVTANAVQIIPVDIAT